MALQETPASVNMGRVAEIAKCSRQAVYLHFANRTELQIAAARYIDEKFDLDHQVAEMLRAETPAQLLNGYVEFLVKYNPLLHPVVRAADSRRRVDPAVGAAWKDPLTWRRRAGYQIAERLTEWGVLAPHWTTRSAGDWLTVQGSINVWEEFVLDLGYSARRFARVMNDTLSRALLGHNAGGEF